MSDPEDRLRDALAERYRIEREIGQGGMARIQLAHDLKCLGCHHTGIILCAAG